MVRNELTGKHVPMSGMGWLASALALQQRCLACSTEGETLYLRRPLMHMLPTGLFTADLPAEIDAAPSLHPRACSSGHGAQGQAVCALGAVVDIAEQRRLHESLRLLAHAFDSTRDALVLIDANYRVLKANQAMLRLAGVEASVMPGVDLRRWLSLNDGLLHLDGRRPARHRGRHGARGVGHHGGCR